MATITCPKCGTENPADATNCKNCRVNMEYALEHLDEMEYAREHPDVTEYTKQQGVQGTLEKAVSRKLARKKKGLTFLLVAVACFVLYFLMYTAGGTGGGALGGC